IIQHIVKNADLKFIPLFKAKPHVFVCRNNPLVAKDKVTLSDLAPFPRLTYEQGINNSFYFSEELHSVEESYKSIIVTDRATLFNLLIGLDGYTISSGILSSDLNGTEIVSIPLESDEIMEIGYVKQIDRPLSTVSERYLELLLKYIEDYLT
ncbi:MAG: LysR substrate-binding domain-containing protein, partial [Lachnoanaerobaculum saburreum]